MDMEKIKALLSVIGLWIKARWAEIFAAPTIIIEWAQHSSLNIILAIGGTLLLLTGFAAIIVSYIKAIRNKKPETPFALIAYLLVCCAVLCISRLLIMGYYIPEAETVHLKDGDVFAYDQYSLRCGRERGTIMSVLDSEWNLYDDIITWKIDDDLLLQLIGLRSLSLSRSYDLRFMQHEPQHQLFFDYMKSSQNENTSFSEYAFLSVFVLPNMQLSEQPWYADGGETVTAKSVLELTVWEYTDGMNERSGIETEYTILDNRGDTLVFSIPYDMSREFPYKALCYARQIGPDVVIGASYGNIYSFHRIKNDQHEKIFDPVSNVDDLDYLEEPLRKLFNGGIRLIRDPSGAALKKLLPCRISNYPASLKSVTLFSFPCSELIDMSASDVHAPGIASDISVIRFVATGPDGKEHVWSLANGADIHNSISARYRFKNFGDWNDTYIEGKKDPDKEMSDWISGTAVAFEDGWLIKASRDITSGDTQYYFLSVIE